MNTALHESYSNTAYASCMTSQKQQHSNSNDLFICGKCQYKTTHLDDFVIHKQQNSCDSVNATSDQEYFQHNLLDSSNLVISTGTCHDFDDGSYANVLPSTSNNHHQTCFSSMLSGLHLEPQSMHLGAVVPDNKCEAYTILDGMDAQLNESLLDYATEQSNPVSSYDLSYHNKLTSNEVDYFDLETTNGLSHQHELSQFLPASDSGMLQLHPTSTFLTPGDMTGMHHHHHHHHSHALSLSSDEHGMCSNTGYNLYDSGPTELSSSAKFFPTESFTFATSHDLEGRCLVPLPPISEINRNSRQTLLPTSRSTVDARTTCYINSSWTGNEVVHKESSAMFYSFDNMKSNVLVNNSSGVGGGGGNGVMHDNSTVELNKKDNCEALVMEAVVLKPVSLQQQQPGTVDSVTNLLTPTTMLPLDSCEQQQQQHVAGKTPGMCADNSSLSAGSSSPPPPPPLAVLDKCLSESVVTASTVSGGDGGGASAATNDLPRYHCHVCGKRFAKYPNLMHHLRIHDGTKPFQCVLCGKRFTQKSNLRTHVKSHRIWPTTLNGLTNELFSQMNEVLAEKMLNKRFIRSVYQKEQFQTLGFNGPMAALPTLSQQPTTSTTAAVSSSTSDEHCSGVFKVVEGHFRCLLCNAIFADFMNLRKHVRSHGNLAVFPCTRASRGCRQVFPLLTDLYQHMAEHQAANEGVYVCRYCSFETHSLDNYCGHKTDCLPVFPDCGKLPTTVKDSSAVITPLEEHNPSPKVKKMKKWLYCHWCSAQFPTQYRALQHYRDVHGRFTKSVKKSSNFDSDLVDSSVVRDLFHCPQCGRSFKRQLSFENHVTLCQQVAKNRQWKESRRKLLTPDANLHLMVEEESGLKGNTIEVVHDSREEGVPETKMDAQEAPSAQCVRRSARKRNFVQLYKIPKTKKSEKKNCSLNEPNAAREVLLEAMAENQTTMKATSVGEDSTAIVQYYVPAVSGHECHSFLKSLECDWPN